MADRQMTFGLGIKTTADISGINQVKKALQELSTYTTDVNILNESGLSAKQLKETTAAISTLERALDSAFDVNLNGVNFNAFQKSIKASGLSLSDIQQRMSLLGTQGEAAFAKTTAQVYKMNTAVQYSNQLVNKLWESFGNTMKYTAFNAIINTVSGSINKAVGYVKDLDRSLNDIRVVSGQSAEQMDKFAVAANKAAKELSASTTDYTDAALIYYQQGLGKTDQTEVKERTDVTMKMANVTGDTAEKVSQDLTAIWNNFYDGSKSLEYYADVITKLGANTAASSSEISQGLEKFAAIAETVGLSYEYATASIATVVAETRQSADTVGTAFKTIFARLEGLNLGETLDDGTTLNKYSKALESVGINIKDSNGQLKDMDTILDELGAKWETLNKDTQVALAQTVGGARQYNQLVALMDNWDKVKDNIKLAAGSTGELDRQQSVWAERTEAHLEKLNAAAQDLYASLFDTKDLNKWIDSFTSLVEKIDSLVESLGGLKNILPMLMAGGISAFSNKMATGISQGMINKRNRENALEDDKVKAMMLQQGGIANVNQNGTQTSQEIANQTQWYKEMYANVELMTKEERERFNILVDSGAQLIQAKANLEEEQNILTKGNGLYDFRNKSLVNAVDISNALNSATVEYSEFLAKINPMLGDEETAYANILDVINQIKNSSSSLNVKALSNWLDECITIDETGEKISLDVVQFEENVRRASHSYENLAKAAREVANNQESVTTAQRTMNQDMIERNQIQNVVSLAGALGQVSMSMLTIKNLGNIWTNDNLTGGEKILQTVMNLTMALPMMINGLNNSKKIFNELQDSVRNKVQTSEIKSVQLKIEQAEGEKRLALKRKEEAEIILIQKKKYLEEQKSRLEDLKAELEASKAKTEIYAEEQRQKEALKFKNKISDLELEKEANLSLQKSFLRATMDPTKTDEEKLAAVNALNTAKYQATEIDKKLIETKVMLTKVEERQYSMLDSEATSRIKANIAEQEGVIANQEQAVSEQAKIIAQENSNIATIEGTIIENKNSLTKITSALSSGTLTWALIKETSAKVANKIATVALNIVHLASNPIFLGVAFAVGAATAAYTIYTNELKKNATEAKRTAEESRKLTEYKKEEYNAITELSSAYEELGEKMDELSTQQLRNEAYQLCLQYGEESLAVKALSADYEELADIIQETQERKAEELKNSATQTATYQTGAVARSLEEEAGSRYDKAGRGGSTIDLKGMTWQNASEKALFAEIEKLASQYGIEDIFQDSDHIYTDKLAELLKYDQEGLKQILDAYDTEMSKQLLGYFDNMSEELTNLSSDISTIKDITSESIAFGLSESNTDISNYLATRERLINELKETGLYKDDEIENIVNNAIAKSSETGANSSQAYSLAQYLGEDDEDKVNEYFKTIGKLDSSQRQLVSKFADYIKLTNADIGELLNNTENYLEFIQRNDDISNISVSLEAATSSGKFEEKDIDALFLSSDYKLQVTAEVEIDRTTFENLDFSTQSMYASQALITALQNNKPEDYYQDQIDAIGDMITELQDTEIKFNERTWDPEAIDEYRENLTILKNDLFETFGDVSGVLENSTEEQINSIYDLLKEDKTKYLDIAEIDEEYRKVLEDLGLSYDELIGKVDDINELDEVLKQLAWAMEYKGGINSIEEQTAAIESLINTQDELKNSEIDVVDLNKKIQDNYKNLDKTIDNLQSQYQSLQSIVDDYNDNGKLSLDSIQKLVQMDNAFVASLEFEGNQLKLNGEAYSSLMDIQMAYMRQQIMNDLITDIHVITMGEVADETDGATDATYTFAGSINEAVENMKAGQDTFTKWVVTANMLSGADMTKYGDRIQQAIDAAYNKLQMLENVDYFESSGGGSSSKKSEKDMKDYDDEYDRYWDINNAIEKVTHALDELNTKEEKLSRNELISALKAENELLDIQADKYRDLAAEQDREAAELREVLGGYGIQFDEQGQITNYLAQTQQALDDYNAVVAGYNAGDVSDEAFDIYEKNYEKFKDTLDRYDTLYYDEMLETQDKLDEISREIKANNLQGWEVDLELKLDTKTAERDWNDFLGKITEGFKSVYTDFNTQFRTAVFDAASLGGVGGSIDLDINAIKEVEAEIDKLMAGGQSSMYESVSQAQEKLKELQETMKSDAESLFDLYQQGWDRYISAIDEAIDKFEDLDKKFERINSDLSHQSKMIELLLGENAYSYLDSFYNAQSVNYLAQMSSLRDQGEFFKKQYEEAVATFGEDSEAANKFKEAWEKSIDDLHKTEESYIKNLADEYANTLAAAFKKAETELMKGSSYDFVKEQWDLQKDAAKDVYDEQERIYQLQSLGIKYQEAINKASSTKAQQKLQDLYESQVESLENKTELTKYDVELAEKRLAVAEAEAALEDARDAKNSMKVTRDEAGNWTYQYVADEDDVEDKQQALLDAQYEAYEYVKQNVSELKEEMIKLASDWSSTIAELESKMISATEEEKAQYQMMIDWYNEYYATQMNTKAEELKNHESDLAIETNALLQTEYNVNAESYALMTETQKACLDSLSEHALESAVDVYNAIGDTYDAIVENGDIAMRETIDYFNTAASEITDAWSNNPDSVKNAMFEAIETCKQAQLDYTEAVHEGCLAAGEDYTDIEYQIYRNIDATNNLQDATTDLVALAEMELSSYMGYLEDLEDYWYRVGEAVVAAGYELNDYMALLGQATQANIEFVQTVKDALSQDLSGTLGTGNKGGTSGGNNLGDRSFNTVSKGWQQNHYSIQDSYSGQKGLWNNYTNNWEAIGDKAILDALAADNNGLIELTSTNGVYKIWTGTQYTYSTAKTVDDILALLQKYGISTDGLLSFATGGYTGEWSNGSMDGQLAMLHQKELVLNEDDTKNMLDTVSIIRDISAVGSSIENSIAEAISSALMRLTGLTNSVSNTTSNVNTNNSNIYNIQAEFTEATEASEIRDALLSLPALAAQRASASTI